MDIIIPLPLTGLAIVVGVYYMWIAMKRQKGGDTRACFKLAALWSIWTLVVLIYTVSRIPPPSTGPPFVSPSPADLFSVTVNFVFLPAIAVWVLMMLDLIIYVLKTRHRIQAANQSESRQVKALSSL
ncbi:MAG: hypothetical protein KAW94_06130 [Candidatus Thorarchaeota archaeon]|nr:hypothetical protein [Candidatus Thorarchaeota archaeon]